MNAIRSLHILRVTGSALALAFLFHVTVAAAALTEEQKGQAISALETVVATPSPEAMEALYEKLSRTDVSAEEWVPAFQEYLDKNRFSAAVGTAWREVVLHEGPGQEAVARAAGAFAAAALQSALRATPPNLQELDMVLLWLEQSTALAPPLVATIGTGLDAVLRANPIDSLLLAEKTTQPDGTPLLAPDALVPGALPAPSTAAALPADTPSAAAPDTVPAVPAPQPVPSATPSSTPAPVPDSATASPPDAVSLPPAAVSPVAKPAKAGSREKSKKPDTSFIPGAAFSAPAMQVAVTLGYYAGPENIARWMRLPEPSLRIYQACGVWVFDGGMLAPMQVQSLGSLLSALPPAVTGVAVVTFVPLPFSLRTPGVVLPIAPVSPEFQRAPVLLPPGGILPSIPEFTATVARALAQVIQQRELARRPELVKRRDILLLTAESRANSLLAAFLAPGGFAGPDDFFPSLMVLWVSGAETALQAASSTIERGEYEGIYALLLLADLISCGGDTSLVLAANPAGLVVGAESALRRNFVAPGHAYVTGVAAGGHMYYFDGIEYETLTQF